METELKILTKIMEYYEWATYLFKWAELTQQRGSGVHKHIVHP